MATRTVGIVGVTADVNVDVALEHDERGFLVFGGKGQLLDVLKCNLPEDLGTRIKK